MGIKQRRQFRKKPNQSVVAIQLNLDTEGLIYTKWGGQQRCKAGDWLVNNNGEVYSVDQEVFARTYRPVSPGLYLKITPIWAEVATTSGHVVTKEGTSDYDPGDYLVFNNVDETDAYCIRKDKFEAMYEPDES